ncbi:hypothetical protein ACFQZO_24015 [Bradyrhizobium sp. GCM10027634]|uniref:hypothetical protein n=1 Tax=unclassified Bradyrhizobium TaxID=2631580 RepID=UPI00188AB9D8|nr:MULTISPECIES: hypothetical protein [unclassified Bradyrhizobium]MDN5003907.1 hypothetical protein [Bradyrhizobium sp. WYCCWR 12677]QOZ45432.1 hypothetical protein XH89_19540 [Bradyrhizobium sp. CCBAU 53340]
MSARRRNQIDGQFNARLIEMMESPAYRVLSVSAHRVLDRICIELARHGGNDNGKLPVTYDDFLQYGLHRHAIAPAIRELCALGFLKITKQGHAGAGEFRCPNLFLVPWLHCKSTPQVTNDWRRIKTLEEATLIAQAARKASERPPRRRRRPRLKTIQTIQ